MKFAMTCTCGQTMSVEADNLESAKAKMVEMMTSDDMAKMKEHMKMYHKPEEPMPTVEMLTHSVNKGMAPVVQG